MRWSGGEREREREMKNTEVGGRSSERKRDGRIENAREGETRSDSAVWLSLETGLEMRTYKYSGASSGSINQ